MAQSISGTVHRQDRIAGDPTLSKNTVERALAGEPEPPRKSFRLGSGIHARERSLVEFCIGDQA